MYDGIKLFLEWVGYFFIAYLIGYSTFLFLSVVVGSLELYKHRRQEMFKSILPSDYYLPISIIVPAYNEEVTVVDTVRSLLTLEYRAYEIIVVDDGSKDRTSEVLAETFDMHLVHRPIRRQINCQREEYVYETRAQKVPVTLIRKKNGGKADALNMGINAANFPYFICMDADSVLQYDSLRRIAQPILENGNVVAVGGIVRISNDVELENGRVKRYRLPRSILAFMQVLEYDRSFLASRILFDRFNGSLIISGAFGLFKKDTVIAAGGYDSGTMGEDMELVVKLHEYCTVNNIDYAIRYASDAICWTQAPERLRDLCKQRKRWHLGLFQSMYKHRVMFSNHRFGAVSFVSCSATRFLRNRDRIVEKKSPILRSISEARSLASTAPPTRGAAHARGRAFLGSGRSGFCRPSLCLLPSCGGLPFRLLVRAFCGLLGPFLGLHGLGVLRPAIDAGLPYVPVDVGRPLLAVVGNLRALAVCVMRPEGLHPVGELLERVADLCPHGGRLRGFSVLPGVGDVMDGAVELPLVLDDVARLAPPILIPGDKELGIFCDGGVVELLGLGRFDKHELGDGLGGLTPLLSVRDGLDGLLRC